MCATTKSTSPTNALDVAIPVVFPAALAPAKGKIRRRSRSRSISTGSARERLLELARSDVQVLCEAEAFFKVVNREAPGFRPERTALVVEHIAPFIGAVVAAIEHGLETGDGRRDVPAERLALVFAGLLSLAFAQHRGSGGAWPRLDEIPALVATLFMDGASRTGPGKGRCLPTGTPVVRNVDTGGDGKAA